MSPRAACRLEAIGFTQVHDYVLGKADWKAAGLALESDHSEYQTVSSAMRPDMPTCEPTETIEDVRKRLEGTEWNECVVIDCDGIVVGRLRESAWKLKPTTHVSDAMQAGPTTVRADGALDKLVARMDRRPTPLVVVTTPQGNLLGVVVREDAKRILDGESPEMVWAECPGCPGQWRPKATPS